VESPATPEELLLQKENYRVLRHQLNRLHPKQALVLKRRFMEDRTFKEVAKELRVSITRVQGLQAMALRKLRHPAIFRALHPRY
jgi:RNA polymerase sigma factor (sigma-70 family)